MKTFRWTVPEPPMTEREKNPPPKGSEAAIGAGEIIGGIVLTLLGFMYLSTSTGFIKGLKTYFWESKEGYVLSSDLQPRAKSIGGEVTYRVQLNHSDVESTDEFFAKWRGNDEDELRKWTEKFSEGSSVKIYYSDAGETSLGRWPNSYSYIFGVSGILNCCLGLVVSIRGIRKVQRNHVEKAP